MDEKKKNKQIKSIHGGNTPIEKHETAAWANFESNKEITDINIPDERQVWNAKEYVDSNQK